MSVRTDVSAPDVPDDGFRSTWVYTVDGTGAITIDHQVDAYGERMRALPWLPRVGMSMAVPDSFGQLDWYGRGPGESYPDRKDAQHIGRWSQTVDESWFDFLPPQDNGVKTDTWWAVLSGDRAGCRCPATGWRSLPTGSATPSAPTSPTSCAGTTSSRCT